MNVFILFRVKIYENHILTKILLLSKVIFLFFLKNLSFQKYLKCDVAKYKKLTNFNKNSKKNLKFLPVLFIFFYF